MAKTRAEQLEYSRGYRRGRNRVSDFASRAFRIARTYREQAAALRRVMWGKDNWTSRECQSCERWTRGGPTCKWGVCSAKFLYEVGEPMMHADSEITTSETFVCCNHLAGNPLRSAC